MCCQILCNGAQQLRIRERARTATFKNIMQHHRRVAVIERSKSLLSAHCYQAWQAAIAQIAHKERAQVFRVTARLVFKGKKLAPRERQQLDLLETSR